jgi:recombination protein RecA
VAATARISWGQKTDRFRSTAEQVAVATAEQARGEQARGEQARSEQAQAELAPAERWGLDALRGRLVELSARGAAATLTTAIDLVLEAQQAAEPVAWVTLGNATFYPPDVAASGVDLAALAVIRVHDTTAAARAAERLLRSGGFGLVVLDLGGAEIVELPIAHQGRLVTLAQTHDAAVVCITEKPSESPSLGSLVSLRAEALRLHRSEHDYDVTLRAIKDKRRGPGWSRTFKRHGPSGL